jgi:pyridoxine 5-phosphate synthase
MNQQRSIRLGVNIDHAATLRQARYRTYGRLRGGIVEPDPLALALEAERAGAEGITVHPREDGRHIQRGDVTVLKEQLQVPLNMEMACTEEMLEFALSVLPHSVCLVPEERTEVTTEGGLDVAGQRLRVGKIVKVLRDAGIEVSLFIDPESAQIDAGAELGASIVELHTGAFANNWPGAEARREFERLQMAARQAAKSGLTVNLGHGINYKNIRDLRGIPGIYEMNIGHSIISRALFTGIREAVREMQALMNA